MKRTPDQFVYPKADLLHRAVGRFADVVIAALLAQVLPDVLDAALAISYLLLADGLFAGQSLGKKMGGVKVVNARTREPALYRESIIRNLPFALVALFFFIPILGWVLFPLGGLFIFSFEGYMAWTDRLGLRIGDVFADTQVVDASVPVESGELVAVGQRGAAGPSQLPQNARVSVPAARPTQNA